MVELGPVSPRISPARSVLLFLLRLAWESRARLPFIITACFMVFDVRMQLEINLDVAVHEHELQENDAPHANQAESDDDDDEDELYDDESGEDETDG